MHADLEILSAELRATLAALSTRQTQAAPTHRQDKWSIQQIAEHLLLTYRSTADALELCLKRGRATRSIATGRQCLYQWVIVTLGHFPRGRKAPEAVDPSMPSILLSGAQLSERLSAELARMDSIMNPIEARFGGVRVMSHMTLGPMSIWQWRRFHLVHGLHHIKQIHSIRKDLSF